MLHWFVSIVLLATSCTRSDNKKNGSEFPYPSTEEQRKTLAAKNLSPAPRLLDSTGLVTDLIYLSSDQLEGRQPGTNGHRLAVDFIGSKMRVIGLDSITSIEQIFPGKNINGNTAGKNLVGLLRGTQKPDKYIVLSAHYDHLGKDANNDFFNGADDNASGVAALLAIADYLEQHPIAYSVIFCAFDREESGFEGAKSFVQAVSSEIALENIVLNINLDMIARADRNEIFVSGLTVNPTLKYLVEKAQEMSNVYVLMGHEGGSSGENWLRSSDHAAFLDKKIPFLYFGVEDHPDYHQPTDEVDKINFSRYTEIANMLNEVLRSVK